MLVRRCLVQVILSGFIIVVIVNCLMEIDQLLAQLLNHTVIVGLILVVLIDHEHSTLLVVPLNVALKSNLFATFVSCEEREVR